MLRLTRVQLGFEHWHSVSENIARQPLYYLTSLSPPGPVAVGSTASATFQVKSAEYLSDLGSDRLVEFTVSCLVESPKQSVIFVESKRLHGPNIAVQINGKGESHTSIKNVLHK